MAKKRGVDPIDREVGRRIKMYRRMLGFSQSELGDFIGITFQQVCKYESGANRVSSSRIQQIANALGLPVSSFFDGPESARHKSKHISPFDLANISGGVRLARAFSKIKHEGLRKDIVELVACIADYGENLEAP
jgi:transcriptional regulator with XRE-family HTH domain